MNDNEDKKNTNDAEDDGKNKIDDGANKSLAAGKNAVTSNSPPKERKPSEIEEDVDTSSQKKPTPSTSGPKGTEEPGSDKGPGGTGW